MSTRHRMRIAGGLLVILAGVLIALTMSSPQAEAQLTPFGHSCSSEYGVRFCPTSTLAQRVPSFDGVPLDVDVTLPASGKGPFPTIVMLHPWGGDKSTFEATSAAGDDNETYDYNNVYYAQHGFAVVNYSARGWGNSCGTAASRTEPACAEGWVRVADQRYEAHDTQFLLGELVDEHIAKPGHLGVTGISYGGGQSIELAYLKNRVRLPDGAFERWRSPDGVPLAIDAAWARWPWSDYVSALSPNGRFLDTQVESPTTSREPIGVQLQDYDSALIALAEERQAYLAPSGRDPEADMAEWIDVLANPGANPGEAAALTARIAEYHQGYGLSGKPAPMLLQSGWTDDLLPLEQSLRVYNAVRAAHGQVALQVGDLGHPPASNKENEDRAFDEQGARFFIARLQHKGAAPKAGSVTAYTLTCPESEPAGGPYTATSWPALHPGRISFGSAATQSFTSAGGNPATGSALNPITGIHEECQTFPSEEEANTAVYTTTSPGFTLLGLTTVTATVHVSGAEGQIDARLWDVMPDGQQRLIDRGVYRLTEDQQGRITFQLHGAGYRFAAGDTVKLQLLGRDPPYYKASATSFSVDVSGVSVALPLPAKGTGASR